MWNPKEETGLVGDIRFGNTKFAISAIFGPGLQLSVSPISMSEL